MRLFASTAQAPTPVPDELLARLAGVPVANTADGMGRLGMMDSRIRPVYVGARLCGRAHTVWTRAGDNRAIHEAIAGLRPGDVLVVNGEGDRTRALLGELIAARVKLRGAVGIVIDGAVRDVQGLADYDMPTFACAVTGAGPYKNGPGAVGVPVAVGGVVVSPGDVVIGDDDGVVVVPSEHAVAAAEAGEAKQAAEDATRADLESAMRRL